MSDQQPLGISGTIAKRFLTSEITPLLAFVGLLLGVFAVLMTPKEEEPQINVTFANIFISMPGASAEEVENLISVPAEQLLSEIEGMKHVFSTSRPGMAILTVQFKVGEDPTEAIVRLYTKIYSNSDWLPPNLGAGLPIIKPKGIDDVPIVSITLWSNDPDTGAFELGQTAHALEAELKRVQGTRDIYTIGAPERVVSVALDPQALASRNIDINDITIALQAANSVRDGIPAINDNAELLIQAGTFLSNTEDIGKLVIGVSDGRAIYLNDVAKIKEGPAHPDSYVWMGAGPQADKIGLTLSNTSPAVTIAIAKKPGTNAVDIADAVIQRMKQLEGIFIPEGVSYTVTRNYGATADAKAKKLITKLIFVTLSVVVLVALALGWREALVVGAAVVVTLSITLFASWAWGFTINRVSLFALIFSIGILVDDAIVVVENIHRHLAMGAKDLLEAIPIAVDEVGGPTILATFTVIAALLPMAFVSGLMGPYMSPIPINASMGMLISLIVAFVLTPWMTRLALGNMVGQSGNGHQGEENVKLHRFFTRMISPFLDPDKGRRNRVMMILGVLILIGASMMLVVSKHVVLKMLPFDNKSEFQVVLDMPEGTALERTAMVLDEMGRYVGSVKEVTDYQIYAGTAAPINFNGLVRQYYLREGPHLGDIQVNLVDKHDRERKSHDIALAMRAPLREIALRYGGNVKVVEVPPGPPVYSPLVAEIYGLNYEGQIKAAKTIRKHFENTADIVDVDDSVEFASGKIVIEIDRAKAALLGISQSQITSALSLVLQGEDATYLHGKNIKYAVPIRLEYAESDKARLENILALKLRGRDGTMTPLSEVVEIKFSERSYSIHHKDLSPVVYVTGDMAGDIDSPLYGLLDIAASIRAEGEFEQWFVDQPESPYEYSIKWDGEWQITYETFRDMGIAYSVGLVLIYLLVVAQFKSYVTPLVIMAPIPLTVIGILPGHALMDAQFTATSMIGMIALAGIIVRNSILLVDFVNQQVEEGIKLEQAVINAATVRSKPIILTAMAAMAGAFFILDDPIFNGLAVSLIFGLFVSTLLTLVVIPVGYFASKITR